MGRKDSEEKHKSAMFCPTNIVLVAGYVRLVPYRDFADAMAALALMYTRTCTFIYIFVNVYIICIQHREMCMHNVNVCAVYICEGCV